VGGLRPEWDFCPRRLPGLGERNDIGDVGDGAIEDNAWNVWERVGG
jgi:hypothetical protein